jgi:hypothetical protein
VETIILEFLKTHAGDALGSGFTEKLTVFMIAWWFVKRGMKEHLGKIESGLTAVATNVGELKEAMTKIETAHSTRIGALETGFKQLNDDVRDIKSQKE